MLVSSRAVRVAELRRAVPVLQEPLGPLDPVRDVRDEEIERTQPAVQPGEGLRVLGGLDRGRRRVVGPERDHDAVARRRRAARRGGRGAPPGCRRQARRARSTSSCATWSCDGATRARTSHGSSRSVSLFESLRTTASSTTRPSADAVRTAAAVARRRCSGCIVVAPPVWPTRSDGSPSADQRAPDAPSAIVSRSRTANRWCSHSSSRITCRQRADGLRVLRCVRVLARGSSSSLSASRWPGSRAPSPPGPRGPRAPRRTTAWLVVKTDRSTPSPRRRVHLAERVEGLLALQDRLAAARCRWPGPGAAASARTTTRRPPRRRPCRPASPPTRSSVAAQVPFERGPRRPQAVRVRGPALGAAGEPAVELGLDERDDVDAVDPEGARAVRQPRRVDVRALDVDPAHHDTGEVGLDEPGTAQVDAGELSRPAGRRTGRRWPWLLRSTHGKGKKNRISLPLSRYSPRWGLPQGPPRDQNGRPQSGRCRWTELRHARRDHQRWRPDRDDAGRRAAAARRGRAGAGAGRRAEPGGPLARAAPAQHRDPRPARAAGPVPRRTGTRTRGGVGRFAGIDQPRR